MRVSIIVLYLIYYRKENNISIRLFYFGVFSLVFLSYLFFQPSSFPSSFFLTFFTDIYADLLSLTLLFWISLGGWLCGRYVFSNCLSIVCFVHIDHCFKVITCKLYSLVYVCIYVSNMAYHIYVQRLLAIVYRVR